MDVRRHKYIIVGAGPSGLQLGYFMEKNQKDYVILERNQTAGSFFSKYPLHRKLISINKKNNYFPEDDFNLRHDWNSLLSDDPEMRFTEYSDDLFPSADRLYEYLQDFAKHFDLNITYGTTVSKIKRYDNGHFHLATEDGVHYECEALFLGLGPVKALLPDDIEGIELATVYDDQILDPETYRNKRVCIIGQGNSAFETAEFLSGIASFVHVFAKEPIKFAWNTHFVGDVRAVNNNIFDMYQLKSLHAVLNPRLKRITRLENGCLQTNHSYDYPNSDIPGSLELTREYDHIICCSGWRWFDEELFDESAMPLSWKRGKFPKMTPIWESENVPNMFFIGAAMQSIDRKASSAFIHGFRYAIRTLFKLIEERYENIPLPSKTIKPLDWDKLLDWMYERFSIASAIFQLFGVLSDVVVLADDMTEATIFEELPFNHVRERHFDGKHVLVFTLEFGFDNFKDPAITFMGPSDPVDTSCAAFLHPVIRHIYNGEETEFHFGDSLLARWDRPHGDGGAVMSYHYLFQKWLENQLGIDLNLPEPVEGGPYRRWSQEEIENWKLNNPPTDSIAKCVRPV
ncbi:pyridine nucleotide-disulfide oxidoreductase [Leptolyngbyaceae cyanobacterium CCMR0082]|uniref:Pyridine nucleotide-disulfide oxidoreductase n=2 Tax=Adonisia turfae TaxID=2950184 RepID=A0A6M0S9Z8_9CYAN|nr:NAD(P)-binding domain-containing protein [Adonisia turfae]MDV3347339.1 NAD(P)-binding domain-containing protein [Leptothoe sp. LEGE 181152]NEZ55860.1 pyridine nucleotide-disulfide oxidoreductase [Adonisia turfae CCMR0081]NEZ65328.1 pyridine nucleotide-disulfide oxidoreductase [Adonisia turfae CCMR0082]